LKYPNWWNFNVWCSLLGSVNKIEKWILKWLLLCLWIFKFAQITFKEIWRGTEKSQISIWRILEDLQWQVLEKIRKFLPMIENEKLSIQRFQNHFCNQNSTKSKPHKSCQFVFSEFWQYLKGLCPCGCKKWLNFLIMYLFCK
jgi:hypothetical protein